MNIVFMGTPEFAAICLKEILDSKHKVSAVVTVPDKPAGRGRRIRKSDVAKLAEEKGIKLLQPVKLKDSEFIKELEALNADAFVVVAFRMLPKEVWQIPSKGTFNLHASLLPQYRGAAPINWAIINGEKETGVTTFLIDEDIDTGNILLKSRTEILPEDDAGTLHDKLAESGKKLIIQTLDGLENNSLKAQSQKEEDNLKSAPKIFREDCEINWNQPIEKVHNFIRGLNPYPGAQTKFFNDSDEYYFKILKGFFDQNIEIKEKLNTISFEKDELIIHLNDGNYHITEIQPENKKKMPARDFINGLKIKNNWKLNP